MLTKTRHFQQNSLESTFPSKRAAFGCMCAFLTYIAQHQNFVVMFSEVPAQQIRNWPHRELVHCRQGTLVVVKETVFAWAKDSAIKELLRPI